jgi:glycosyl hydrolase family 99
MSGWPTRRTGAAKGGILAAAGLVVALAAGPAWPAEPAQAQQSYPAYHARAGAAQVTAGPVASGRVTPPAPLLAYFYQWFNHSSWNRAKKDYPLIGTYSSSDRRVMREQIRQAKAAGIGGFIVSWKDTPLNNGRLRLLMAAAAQERFKLAMIYQGLDFHRRPLPASRVAADFVMFRDTFARSPVFFRLGGKPLTIWSGIWAFSVPDVARVTSAVRPDLLVLATEKDATGFQRVAHLTDGDAYYWSSVNPDTYPGYGAKLRQMSNAVHRDGKYWIAPFAPGFDARMVGGTRFVPRLGGQTLRTEYATALRSSPDVLGLISWNEFSENTHVEPSVRYRYQSLNTLRQLRSTSVPAPAGPAAPSDEGSGRPGSTASTAVYVGNLLRLAGFPVVLVAAVALLAYTRRRARAHPTGRPPRQPRRRSTT